MKLSFENLMFQENDILNIEDETGRTVLIADRKHDCEKCYFYGICGESNFMSRFCKETHFVEKRNGKSHDKK